MNAPLIWHVEKYLRTTGMCASSFGREAAHDPGLVFDLRRGREPGAKLASRVKDYMEERGPDPVVRHRALPKKHRAPRHSVSVRQVPVRADAVRELRPALNSLMQGQGNVISHRERPWASATFVGARHYWTWSICGDDHAALAARVETKLPDHEFNIRGHLVADALVTERRVETLSSGETATIVTLEILTLEEE